MLDLLLLPSAERKELPSDCAGRRDVVPADVLLAARRWQTAHERARRASGGRAPSVQAAEAELREAVGRFVEDVPDLVEARQRAAGTRRGA